MTNQIVNLVTQNTFYIFSNNQAFLIFDNIINHACFAKNVFLAKKINLDISRK